MNFSFNCPSCDAKFEAPESLAGKRARCKRCQAEITIPSRSTPNRTTQAGQVIAPEKSVLAVPVQAQTPPGRNWIAAATQAGLKPVSTATQPPPRANLSPAKDARSSQPDWVTAVNSQVALKPLSMAAMPAIKKVLPSALDEDSFTGPYKVATAPARPYVHAEGGSVGRPAGIVKQAYRGQIGGIQGLARWLNDSAYLLSIPFIAVLFFGVLLHNRPLALLGATLVVLLNLSRLVTGLTNLILIPFKDSPIQGLLFLIPPVGIFYCLKQWKRVKKPLKRIAEPAITIAAVALAFTFVPWLRTGATRPSGDLKSQISSGIRAFESDVQKEIGTLPADLKKLPANASKALQKQDKPETAPASKAVQPGQGPLDQLRGVTDQLKNLREMEQ